MTLYTHTEMPGKFGELGHKPEGGRWSRREVHMPDGTSHPPSWFRTSSAQAISAAGFRVYTPPEPEPPTFAERQKQKQQAVRAKRWQVETGGITVNGAPIRTDDVGQSKIQGATQLFDKDPSLTEVDWEAQPGIWVTLNQAEIEGIGVAVGRHIQACFSHARTLSEAITAATTDAELDAIDIETGWPS